MKPADKDGIICKIYFKVHFLSSGKHSMEFKSVEMKEIDISHRMIILVPCSAERCHAQSVSLKPANKTRCFPFSLLRTEPCWPLGTVNRSMMVCFAPLSPLLLDVWRASLYFTRAFRRALSVGERGCTMYVHLVWPGLKRCVCSLWGEIACGGDIAQVIYWEVQLALCC